MKELLSHIETLLQDNDCVIVPDFGGFVTYRLPAQWAEERETYLPPTRTVGFNPSLIINDGLLAQAYMSEYGTSFPDAQRRVERAVRQLKDYLYTEGRININEIGVLHVNNEGCFQFVPYLNGLTSPQAFGLSDIHVKLIEQQATISDAHLSQAALVVPFVENNHTPASTSIWSTVGRVAAAAVIAFALFYAQPTSDYSRYSKAEWIGVAELNISKGEAKSVNEPSQQADASLSISSDTISAPTPQVDAEILTEISNATTPQVAAKNYYIVVSTWQTLSTAEERVADMKKRGYENACIVKGASVYRVCVDAAATVREAQELQKVYKEKFDGMWIHHFDNSSR